ncbi:MAG: gamma-glutamyltransferase [Pseudomonadota bacterium]
MPQAFTTRPEIRGTFGAVTSTHWLASTVGFGILERGGNAFDAAVATGFTLQIVEPHLNGPGGDVPIIVQAAGWDRPRVLCGQGVAPAAATIEALRALGYDRMPGMGLAPAVVPGAFGAWLTLLAECGTLRLRDVLEPAIGYAANGYTLPHRAAEAIHAAAPLFREHWHHSAEVWTPGGRLPKPQERSAQPQIADTYRRILDVAEAAGPDRETQIEAARHTWYKGFVAEAIDAFYRTEQADGSGGRCAGLLTGQDMAAWQPNWEDTVSAEFHGHTIHKTGPWGQGPFMLQTLRLLEARGIANIDPASADYVHLVIEALKLCLADRDAFFGDPDHVDVPLDALLADDYIQARARQIGDHADLTLSPGDPLGDDIDRAALLAELAADPEDALAGAGDPTFADLPEMEGDTCHLDVVDAAGNLVSATPSGGWLQSAPAVPGLGFNLTTRGQMYWLDDRLPSHIAPGRRPRTTLTPTVVTRDGRPVLGLGSPGGDQQDQWAIGMLLRHMTQGMNLQAAIDAPLFHTGHYINSFAPRDFTPGALHIEDRFRDAVRRELAERGHNVITQDAWSLGRLCAAGFMPDGIIRAAATPRFMQAYAVGR